MRRTSVVILAPLRIAVLVGLTACLSACGEDTRRPAAVTGPSARRDGGAVGDGSASSDADLAADASTDAGLLPGEDARPTSTEDAAARDATILDARPFADAAGAPDATSSCVELGCVGATYCDVASGQCRPGCERDDQCGVNERCDRSAHACTCVSGALQCGAGCAACPSDPGVAAVGCAGTRCAATSCASGFDVCGSTCCPATPMWTVETAAFGGGAQTSMVLDATDQPIIAYSNDAQRGLYHVSRSAAGGWGGPVPIDLAINALYPSLAWSGGAPVIAYAISDINNDRVLSSRFDGVAWRPDAPISASSRPSLASGGGREHLVTIGGASSPYTLRHASRLVGTTTWSAAVTVASGVSYREPRASVSSNGTAHIVYSMPNNQLYLAQATAGGAWSTTRVSAGPVYESTVVTDAQGAAHILYYLATNSLLMYEVWSGSSLLRQAVVDVPGGVPPGSTYFSGLDIAHDGTRAHVSYLDFTRNSVLRYAVDAVGFTPQTVTGCDDILGSTSIVVDAAGAPHISFPAPTGSWSDVGYAVYR